MNKEIKNSVEMTDEELLDMFGGFDTKAANEFIVKPLYGIDPVKPIDIKPLYGIDVKPIIPLYGIQPSPIKK